MLSVTNTFEGAAFVNSSISDTVQVTEYVAELFPDFSPKQSSAVVAQYAGLGTNFSQVVAIMGECEYACPSPRRDRTGIPFDLK